MFHIPNKAAIAINNGKYHSLQATVSKQPRFKNSWWVTASCFQRKMQNRSIYSFQFEWRKITVQFLGETFKFCVYLLGTLNWILLRCFVSRSNKRLQWKTIRLKSQIIKYWKGSTEKCDPWWLEKFSMSIRWIKHFMNLLMVKKILSLLARPSYRSQIQTRAHQIETVKVANMNIDL